MKAVIAAFITGVVIGLAGCYYIQDGCRKDLQAKVEFHKCLEDAAKAEAGVYHNLAVDADKRAHEWEQKASVVRERIVKIREATGQSEPSSITLIEPSDMTDLVAEQGLLISLQDDQILALRDGIKARDGQIVSLEKALKQADIKAQIQAEASKAAFDGLKRARWVDRSIGFVAGYAISYGVR
jgi:hypothetical protein